MQDLTPDQVARFDARHAALLELRGHPTVQDLAKQLMSGGLTALQFLIKLREVPEIARALGALGDGVETVVGAVVTGAAAPLGPLAPLAGAGAVALFHLASGALLTAGGNTSPPASPVS